MSVDDKILKLLNDRKLKYESEVLKFPPKTLEALQLRVGQYNECIELIDQIGAILRGKEDE